MMFHNNLNNVPSHKINTLHTIYSFQSHPVAPSHLPTPHCLAALSNPHVSSDTLMLSECYPTLPVPCLYSLITLLLPLCYPTRPTTLVHSI